jgi:CubicO group peptidase (beta-lactamase class C family)
MKRVVITSTSILLCLSTWISGRALAATAADRKHIYRIENNLLPGILINGRTIHGMNLIDRMKHYKVPGVSIAFFSRGRILWTRAYGYADVSRMRVVTSETLFQAASISKPISSLAVLRLVQDGKLNLDEDVNVKLKSWKVPNNEFTEEQKVTLRRILSHSAGLTVDGFPGYLAGEPLPRMSQILDGEKPANTKPVRVDTVPGTMWRYSGGGYTVMQLLLTEVTGKPFPDILKEEVLRPAGMSHSTFVQPLPKSLQRGAATAYGIDGIPIAGDFHTYPEMAAAGLWTTPSDLARAAIEIQKDYAGTSNKLISKDMARQMLTRQKDNWGLGVALAAADHPLRFGHGGSNEGFRCDFEAYVQSGQGIVIMTNANSGDALIGEIRRAVAQEYAWPDFRPEQKVTVPVDLSALSAYPGLYQTTAGDVVQIELTLREGRLYLQAAPFGAEPVELYPESASQFFAEEGFSITLHRNEDGSVSTLTLHAGQVHEAEKISALTDKKYDEEAEAVVRLRHEGRSSTLRLVARGSMS